MVELKQKTKVVKRPHCYKHFIEVTYPKENVRNMLGRWKEAVDEAKDFLKNYEDTFNGSLNEGYAAIERERNQAMERKNELLALSREERAEKLLKEFDEFVKNLDVSEEEFKKRKKEYKEALESQMRPMKAKCKETIQQKEEAIKLWENPEIQN